MHDASHAKHVRVNFLHNVQVEGFWARLCLEPSHWVKFRVQRFSKYCKTAMNNCTENHAIYSWENPWKQIHVSPRSTPGSMHRHRSIAIRNENLLNSAMSDTCKHYQCITTNGVITKSDRKVSLAFSKRFCHRGGFVQSKTLKLWYNTWLSNGPSLVLDMIQFANSFCNWKLSPYKMFLFIVHWILHFSWLF